MASLLIPTALSPTPPPSAAVPTRASFRHSHVTFHRGIQFSRNARGLTVVTRAGPSTSSYVFAFVLPLSLLALTVLASIRVADRLDEKFLEELILNEATNEDEEEDEEEDADIVLEEKLQEPVLPRIRNRPKKEI